MAVNDPRSWLDIRGSPLKQTLLALNTAKTPRCLDFLGLGQRVCGNQMVEQALAQLMERARRLNLTSGGQTSGQTNVQAVRQRPRRPLPNQRKPKPAQKGPTLGAPPPPPPPSPRQPRPSELRTSLDSIIAGHKDSDQLVNKLLEQARSINEELFHCWQHQRTVDLVQELEMESSKRRYEKLMETMRKEYAAKDLSLRSRATQTEQQPGPAAKRSANAATQSEATPTPRTRLEQAISGLSSLPPVPSTAARRQPSSPTRDEDGAMSPTSSLSSCGLSASSASFRPLMSEYRSRVHEIRQLTGLIPGAEHLDAAERETRLLHIRAQGQRSLIFYDMMRFAEEELMQMLPTDPDTSSAPAKCTAVLESGTVGDFETDAK